MNSTRNTSTFSIIQVFELDAPAPLDVEPAGGNKTVSEIIVIDAELPELAAVTLMDEYVAALMVNSATLFEPYIT